jgi:hypothetical protein
MFCAPGLVFGVIECVGSRFLVLRARTHFRRYRGRRVPMSCFARLDSFSAVPRASGPVLMFCAPRLVFGVTEGVGSRFHVLRARTSFRRYRGHRVPFSCLARPDSFPAVAWASGPVFMFCAPGLIFGGTEGVWSCFPVLRSRTHFRRYRGRRVPFSYFALLESFLRYRGRWVPFSCFALPFSFSTVLRASRPVFMFCSPGLIFGGSESVVSRFHVLRSLTRFLRYRVRRVLCSCLDRPDSFSALPRASGPVFMFYALGIVFGGAEGVGSRFHVMRSRDRFSALSSSVFMFCAPGLVFGCTEGVWSRFHVLRSIKFQQIWS